MIQPCYLAAANIQALLASTAGKQTDKTSHHTAVISTWWRTAIVALLWGWWVISYDNSMLLTTVVLQQVGKVIPRLSVKLYSVHKTHLVGVVVGNNLPVGTVVVDTVVDVCYY